MMDTKDFERLVALSKSPELFEKKRQQIISDFICSAASNAEKLELRRIQDELDSDRDQSLFQLALAKKILQQVEIKKYFLKELISSSVDHLSKDGSNVSAFPARKS